jgi:hypothetical protein
MKSNWPFEDAPNSLVHTTRGVLEEDKPILVVTHDHADGVWQFLSEIAAAAADARITALGEIVFHDPGVLELADLPLGWAALRDSRTAPWKRRLIDKNRGVMAA